MEEVSDESESKKNIASENDTKSASVNNDENKSNKDSNGSNTLPSDDSIPNNPGGDIKINKYLIIGVAVIVILLIIAYFFYHYNILGARVFVRHALGLSTSSYTANYALKTLVSSNFAGVNKLNLSSAAVSAEGLNSSNFKSYTIFGAGNVAKDVENGSLPPGVNGLLIFIGALKNNQSLGYYYHVMSASKNLYNITIGGIPAIEGIENTTPPENSSYSGAYGAFNLTGYRCNSSGFDAILYSKLNQTVKITNASIYSIANMSRLNSSVFNSSVKFIKPNETFNVLFPEEKCNASGYSTQFTISTNYSISSLRGFVSFVKFSPYLVKQNQSELITVLAVNNSTLYEISALSNGNNYVDELNSGFNTFIKGITLSDFT
ncbi:MAG: hypothetical protein ACP5MV_03925 [Candidatus Parvarchaeum sp.]